MLSKSFVLYPYQIEALEVLSKRDDVSRSELLRQHIDSWLTQRLGEKVFQKLKDRSQAEELRLRNNRMHRVASKEYDWELDTEDRIGKSQRPKTTTRTISEPVYAPGSEPYWFKYRSDS